LFPQDTEEQALLKGLAVFGAAFLMRPGIAFEDFFILKQ
jgi:hypothetical protein